MPISLPDHVAQNFLQYFLTAFANGEPFYLSVHQARGRLQEELEDEYPCASWLPVVFQNPAVPELNWPKDNRKLWFGLGGAIALISLGFGLGKLAREINFHNRTSYGEQILIKTVTTPEKQAGVQAFWWQDYQTATENFALSLKQKRNDPETLIYKNNAIIGKRKALTIVVSVPITSNANVAQEILRGVAQAQDEINTLGGINGKLLKVKIADDANDPKIARELASRFVDDQEILAVLGHNASNASVAAAPEYENGKLVMITATSFSSKLSETGRYIFRTVPEVIYFADVLSQYIVKNQGHKNIAICVDSKAQDNVSFSSQIEGTTINLHKGNIVNINCDFADPNFNPEQAINTAISKNVTALVLSPHIDRIDKALLVAKANKGRIKLFGSATLYTYRTLEMGLSAVNGLALSVPWHPSAFPNNPFAEKAKNIWGGSVTWRTAYSYDAMRALIVGLRNSQPQESREKLREALRIDGFVAYGATGEVNFRPSGDRRLNGEPIIVEVQPRKNSLSGYDFVVIKNKKSVDN
jgi:branched-chain amino acid transport system substrate-binding protein